MNEAKSAGTFQTCTHDKALQNSNFYCSLQVDMVEQPKARQARLERLREHNREQRAAEQAKARQAWLARIREASRRRRQAERQSEAQQTTRQAF